MPSQLTSYYANASRWEQGLPMPPNLVEKEQKEDWEKLPADEKIHQILEAVKQEAKEGAPADQTDQVVMRCWEKAKECVTGAKVAEIGKECFQCTKVLERAETLENMVVLRCSDGDIKIPHYLKYALVEESSFFRGLFDKKFEKTSDHTNKTEYELKEISKKDLENLIQIWAGNKEIEDSQEAYELLFIGHRLDLISSPMKKTLLNTVKSWSPTDPEDIAAACKFLKEMESEGYQLPELQSALQEYFVNVYLFLLENQSKGEEPIELFPRPVSQDVEARVLQSLKNLSFIGSDDPDAIETIHATLEKVAYKSDPEDFAAFCEFLEKKAAEGYSPLELQSALIKHLEELANADVVDLETQVLQILNSLNITTLAVDGNRVSDAFLEQLPEICPQLTHLALRPSSSDTVSSNVTDSSLSFLTHLENLKSLDLTRCVKLSDAALEEMIKIPSLEEVNLAYCDKIPANRIEVLAQMPNLKSLDLSYTKLTIEAPQFDKFIKANKLEHLNISGNTISNEALGELSRLTHLNHLEISKCRVLDSDELLSQPFPKCEQLRELDLSYTTQLDEDELNNLVQQVPNLTTLKINGWIAVSSKGLDVLALLKKLNHLEIKDQNGKELDQDLIVKLVANLPNLKTLNGKVVRW